MDFTKYIATWKKYPDVTTAGYYHSLGNYIYLNDFTDEADFQNSLQNPGVNRNRISVYVHENQHYIDQVSTLWGVQNIYRIFRAYNSAFFGNETSFFTFRSLTLSSKKDYFLDYYTELYNPLHGSFGNRWQFQVKTGLRFNSTGNVDETQPILLITFLDAADTRICRVPLSVVSLLETTATSAELNFKISEVSKLATPYREVQLQVLNSQIEDKIYHPELAIYSVAVHIVSVFLQVLDPIIAYRISSIFAKIALNLPSTLFTVIPIPEEFKEDKTSSIRANYLMINLDRGLAFYLLVKNYRERFGKLEGNGIDVKDILASSNLPIEDEIQNLIQEEIDKLDYEILMEQNSFNRQIIDRVFLGNQFRKYRGIGQQNDATDLSEFVRDKPYLIFNSTDVDYSNLDLTPISQKIVMQEDLSREEWFRVFTFCEKRIDNFDLICGI